MRFRTVIELQGNNTGILIPDAVVEGLDRGKRVPVVVTVGATIYRSTITPMGGRYLIALSAANRAAAGVAGGDEVDVDLEVDDAPRVFPLPPELETALTGDEQALAAYGALSFSRQRALAEPVALAKTDATRDKRIAAAVEALRGA
ncbi:YdeI/OmpD-associated family protein [Plantibacter cousiniae (nom. nud.)]|uniref:Bacteriocin-protection, YdeI or OmpD-Associated n=1 Tax=Plantibacter cousiniae (nom. nud.) TaxID=199709 RepID=A0ABY1LI77_9MICO|nr:YdeI/OmpD-associated family protein [Plantibacter cousiniae]SKC43887.1 Bacteriocin-protection, YdeI or OmpD-Associated [Plantibacter cousiniae]